MRKLIGILALSSLVLSIQAGGSRFLDLCEQGQQSVGWSCVLCPDNYGSYAGATECYNCASGSYLVNNGVCMPCPAGTFTLFSNGGNGIAYDCTVCSEGTTNYGTGNTACYSCNPGENLISNSQCGYCPAGTYSTSGIALECTACPEDYTNIGTGNTACYSCQPGQYLADNTNCDYCPSGTTSSGGTALECTPEDSDSF